MRADARRNYDRILVAAIAAFAEHGVNAPMDDIARRAGVGSGTLYRHFPTREALHEAVYRDGVENLCTQAQELLEDPDPAAALSTWFRAFIAYCASKRGLANALRSSIDPGEPYAELFARSREMIYRRGGALLARAKESGAIRADVELTDLLHMINGISMTTESMSGDPDMADRLLEIMMAGLRPA